MSETDNMWECSECNACINIDCDDFKTHVEFPFPIYDGYYCVECWKTTLKAGRHPSTKMILLGRWYGVVSKLKEKYNI